MNKTLLAFPILPVLASPAQADTIFANPGIIVSMQDQGSGTSRSNDNIDCLETLRLNCTRPGSNSEVISVNFVPSIAVSTTSTPLFNPFNPNAATPPPITSVIFPAPHQHRRTLNMRASTISRMEVQPIAVSIPQAAQMIGRGIATIYELLGREEIVGVKSDGRTLVKVTSLQAYIDRCPKVQITARPRRKPQHLRKTEMTAL